MTKGKVIRIIIHILVWVVFIVLPIFLVRRFRMASDFLLTYYTFAVIHAIIFYTNYLFLVPGLFFQKKKYRYYIAVLALVFCFYFISGFASGQTNNIISRNDPEQYSRQLKERQAPRRPPLRPRIIVAVPYARLIGYASSSLFMVFLSLGIRVLERQEEMEKTKLKAELAILKNQISPHFFFNTLNNIYSLIGRNNEDSKDAIVKLSRMMRYVLNEAGQENRFLSDEIEFMSNYIDLMKLRIGAKTRLSVNFPADYRNLMIPHLLFISLIENAFKYGISVQEDSFVNISLECGEHQILFRCENGLPVSNSETNFASPGIGLENLKKRLMLLYPGRHELEINKTKSKFEAKLIIRLK